MVKGQPAPFSGTKKKKSNSYPQRKRVKKKGLVCPSSRSGGKEHRWVRGEKRSPHQRLGGEGGRMPPQERAGPHMFYLIMLYESEKLKREEGGQRSGSPRLNIAEIC